MSCFQVSDTHINALVTFLVEHGIILRADATATAADFKAVNINGVAYAYRHNAPEEMVSRAPIHYAATPLPSPIAAFKMADCYCYQSCDHHVWDSSRPKALCDAILAAAARATNRRIDAASPDYERLAWHVWDVAQIETRDTSLAVRRS